MILLEDHVDLDTPSGPMRTFIYRPKAPGPFPGVVLFSEIYQVTGPIARTARWLAGHGYIVAAPEVYHEFEPLGSPFAYDAEGTQKGNRYKIEKEVGAFDADARAVLDHLKGRPDCSGRLGAMGICLGGHLAFRCAVNADVLATACLYPTDIHKRSLGKGMADDTLDRIGEIGGELTLIWGRQDPHIDRPGRELIHRRLDDAGACFTWHEFNAQHAFIRDEGYRYDPPLAALVQGLVLDAFHRRLLLGEPLVAPASGPSPC